MAEIITPGVAGPLLPAEYQQQIDDARRKNQIAQMLMAQSMGNKGPEQIGPVAAKYNPLAALASVAQTGLGGFMQANSENDATKARQSYENDSHADLVKMLGLPADQQVGYGRASKFSPTQRIADELWKDQQKKIELRSGVFKDAGQTDNALGAIDGKTPQPYSPMQPVTNWIPDPNNPGKTLPLTTNYDKHNIPKAELGAHGTNVGVDVKLPTKEGELALSQIGKTLDEKRGSAQAAKAIYASNTFALDALEKGAQAGGGEPQKQWLRKAGQAFGLNLPETATTEQLNMALGQSILDNAQKIKPVSNTDMENLRQMLGSINTDPTALTRMLAFTTAASLQDLHGFNQYAGENQKSMNPAVQDLFRGATTGAETPEKLFGPDGYRMEVLRQLQRRGVDVSNFTLNDGSRVGENAKFNDINPIAGMPGVAGKAPGAVSPAPATMTPAEQAELEALRKWKAGKRP